jgi:DeoR/GlpR family transcriptional regulator of sugar metabolism
MLVPLEQSTVTLQKTEGNSMLSQRQGAIMADLALPGHRRAELVKYVRERGHATVAELAEAFAVSMDTIRRDLDHLAERRLLARTHGGAMRPGEPATADTPFDSRAAVHRRAKEAIGVAAAELVSHGETLIINGGTTTLAVARALAGKQELTVVTNNLRLPGEIPIDAVRDLYIIGGTCRIASNVTVGPVAFADTRGISADTAIIGVGGISTDGGLSTTNLPEAQMIRQMIDASARIIVVADSSKFGRSAFVHICELARMSVLVADAEPPEDIATELARADVKVVRVTV